MAQWGWGLHGEVVDGGEAGTGCVEGLEVTPAKSLLPTRGLIKPTRMWADMNEEQEEEEERGLGEEEEGVNIMGEWDDDLSGQRTGDK